VLAYIHSARTRRGCQTAKANHGIHGNGHGFWHGNISV